MTDTDLWVTVEVAGQMTGIPARTIRRWVSAGLPSRKQAGSRAALVHLASVQERGQHGRSVAGQSSGHASGQMAVTVPAATEPVTWPAIEEQLTAIIGRSLATLAGRLDTIEANITTVTERAARAEAERDHAVQATDQLRADLQAAQDKTQKVARLATLAAIALGVSLALVVGTIAGELMRMSAGG